MSVAAERWDVVLTILSGPLKSSAESVYRGPIVRIGHNPGPGGVQLAGYRGLDARQCTITAYDGGTAEVSPVGTNQVRIAPHANVSWRDIDPITGPTYLSNGCALHIGPVNRGATLQFVECRRLGVWQGGSIQSNVDQMQGVGGGPPVIDPHKVKRVSTSIVPVWFMGCVSLMLGSTASVLVAATLIVLVGHRDVGDLGPEAGTQEWHFESVPMDQEPDPKLLTGLAQPMRKFIMNPNLKAAGGLHEQLEDPEQWDRHFMRYVTRSVELHVRQRPFFKKLDERREEWGIVLTELRKADLPEVFAAIPYQESQYSSAAQSFVCAKGYWQFMPETANRVDKHYGVEFRVRECRLYGRTEPFTPELLAPPFTRRSPYVQDNKCLIDKCQTDDRTDLRKSTRAAIITLGEAWNDELLRKSGSLVQATILSHNAGTDDSQWGFRRRSSNLVPAMQAYIDKNGLARGPHFYGDNILCETHVQADNGSCGSGLMAETQHYAYNIVAQHFLAVCYYSQEYGSDTAFEHWGEWALDDSYCSNFKIPSKSEVRSW